MDPDRLAQSGQEARAPTPGWDGDPEEVLLSAVCLLKSQASLLWVSCVASASMQTCKRQPMRHSLVRVHPVMAALTSCQHLFVKQQFCGHIQSWAVFASRTATSQRLTLSASACSALLP